MGTESWSAADALQLVAVSELRATGPMLRAVPAEHVAAFTTVMPPNEKREVCTASLTGRRLRIRHPTRLFVFFGVHQVIRHQMRVFAVHPVGLVPYIRLRVLK